MKKLVFIGAIIIAIIGISVYVYTKPDIQGEQYRNEVDIVDIIVYESDAENAGQCTSKETFDAEQKVCRFKCSSEAECAKIEAEINAELDNLGDEYVESAKNFSEREEGETGSPAVAIYAVQNDESITLVKGEASKEHLDAWEIFAKISPNTFTERFVEIYEAVLDVQDGTLAYVHDDDGNGKWMLGINFGTYGKEGKRDNLLTLMHEFTHILTLNNTQVGEQQRGGCEFYDTGDGCALQASYLNSFVQKFWPKSDIAEAQKKEHSTLFAKKGSSFVTEYAATNPEEDIAESFALFILEKKSVEDTAIAQKKVSFFYSYPELVQLRTEMRKVIGGVVLERKRSR